MVSCSSQKTMTQTAQALIWGCPILPECRLMICETSGTPRNDLESSDVGTLRFAVRLLHSFAPRYLLLLTSEMTNSLHLEVTPRIHAFLNRVWARENLPSTLKEALRPWMPSSDASQNDIPEIEGGEKRGVPFKVLKQSWDWLQEAEKHSRKTASNSSASKDLPSGESSPDAEHLAAPREKQEYLHELVAGSRYYEPAVAPAPKDPALVQRLDRMRAQVENRLYAKMVENVSNEWRARAAEEARADLKTGLDTAKLSLNLLLSPLCVFAALYFVFWAPYRNTIISIVAGTIGAIAIFLVEMLLFVIRGSQLDAKVASQRQDAAMGIQSPFPPTAPSLIAAERKAQKDALAARRQQRLLTSESASNTSSTATRAISEASASAKVPKTGGLSDFQLPVLSSASAKPSHAFAASSSGPVIDDEDDPEGDFEKPAPLLPVEAK